MKKMVSAYWAVNILWYYAKLLAWYCKNEEVSDWAMRICEGCEYISKHPMNNMELSQVYDEKYIVE